MGHCSSQGFLRTRLRNPPWSLPLFSWDISSDRFCRDPFYVLFPLKFSKLWWFHLTCSALWPMPFWSSSSSQRAILTFNRLILCHAPPVIMHPALCKTVPVSTLTALLYAHWEEVTHTFQTLPYTIPLSITRTTFPLLPCCLPLFLFLLQISSTFNS